jgi:hypothetical protein
MKREQVLQQKKERRNGHLIRYAFHEAGHAVVAHVIGRCVAEVSIIRDRAREYRGYCLYNAFAEDVYGLPQWRDGTKNPECTTIMYAGTIAMQVLCEQRGWNYEHWRSIDTADFDDIYLWSLEMFDNDEQRHAMQKECQRQARDIVICHWKAVETLAATLLAKGKVNGWEAHILIQQTIDATVTDWRMGIWNTAPSHQFPS